MPEWVASVGMEVHAELNTRSKMFCRCPVAFGGPPNTRTCPVCLGLPGSLPAPNKAAIEKVLRAALALNCTIATRSVFHRKNYFYPDLPKGYQISQYGETNPIGYSGWLDVALPGKASKRVRIRRVHLEEDTGKLLHLPGGGSGVDYNRSGVPLMEIVTEFPPDIESAEEAKEYLVQLRNLLLYLDVTDGKMEEGSLRCEPNVSVRPRGSKTYGTKTELKNLNSFRSVQLGIEHETKRQIAILEAGGKVRQETRGWSEERLESFPLRTKEFEHDYRYFPDPDLAPMVFDESRIEAARGELPELPQQKYRRYTQDLGLSDYDAGLLVSDKEWAEFFEDAVAAGGSPKAVCNWMNSDFAKLLNEEGVSARQSKVTPSHLAELTKLIEHGLISGKIGKEVFAETFRTGEPPAAIVERSGRIQVSDPAILESWARQAIEEHPEAAQRARGGQQGVVGFLVGRAIQISQGRANPEGMQRTIRKLLKIETGRTEHEKTETE